MLTHRCRLLASGGTDATVSVFELQTMTCLRTFAGFDQPARYVSFSHDGQYLAYVAESPTVDPGVYIEEVATGTLLRRFGFDHCLWWGIGGGGGYHILARERGGGGGRHQF